MSIAVQYDKLNQRHIRFVCTNYSMTQTQFSSSGPGAHRHANTRQTKLRPNYDHANAASSANPSNPPAPAEPSTYFKLFYSTPFVSMAGLTVMFIHRPSASNVSDVMQNIKALEEKVLSQYAQYISVFKNHTYRKPSTRPPPPPEDASVSTLTYKSFTHYIHRIIAEDHGTAPFHIIVRINGVYHNMCTNHVSLSYRVY